MEYFVVRAIVWLTRTSIRLSFFVAIVAWFVLGGIWTHYPSGSAADKVIGSLYKPGWDVGHAIGIWLFPNYRVRYSNGSYLVPLFGAAGEVALLMLISYVVIRGVKSLRSEQRIDGGSSAASGFSR